MRPLARTIDAEPAGLHTWLPSEAVTQRGPGSSKGGAKAPSAAGSASAAPAGSRAAVPAPSATTVTTSATSLRMPPPKTRQKRLSAPTPQRVPRMSSGQQLGGENAGGVGPDLAAAG